MSLTQILVIFSNLQETFLTIDFFFKLSDTNYSDLPVDTNFN